jgi:hypothetical protein
MRNSIKTYPLILILFFSVQLTIAQVHNFDSLFKNNESFKQYIQTTPEYKDLFLSDEIMNVSIASDFKNLVKTRGKEEYQHALFQYQINDTILLTRDIKIKARGESRKKICLFPPIKINFPKEEVYSEHLKEFNKMKMVVDCRRGEIYEKFLLSEFMAYKLLNILTDFSYRVRLIRVTYIDISGKYDTDTKYAFIIESKNQMAERLNTIVLDIKSIRDQFIEKTTLINTYLFQYLIGNTDWSIPGDHNIILIKSKDPVLTEPYVVPFDFDLAGIVDANYAKPNEATDISSVRERYYMGICLPDEQVITGMKVYLERKDEIYALYENSDLLDEKLKQKTIQYLDDFYRILEDESKFSSNILESCKN